MSGHVRNKIFTLANLTETKLLLKWERRASACSKRESENARKIVICTQHRAMTMLTKMSFYFTDEYTATIYSVDKLQLRTQLPFCKNDNTHAWLWLRFSTTTPFQILRAIIFSNFFFWAKYFRSDLFRMRTHFAGIFFNNTFFMEIIFRWKDYLLKKKSLTNICWKKNVGKNARKKIFREKKNIRKKTVRKNLQKKNAQNLRQKTANSPKNLPTFNKKRLENRIRKPFFSTNNSFGTRYTVCAQRHRNRISC